MGSLERWARSCCFERVAGVDEAGRGPLAGPVVAAAVLLPAGHAIEGLDDSKKLTARKRERLAAVICNRAEGWGIGVVGPRRIDEVNIRVASLEAMSRAFGQLLAQGLQPDLVLTDGRDEFVLPEQTPLLTQRAFPKADGHSEMVAAASILAKVYRDALMQEYHAYWPVYGFNRHKGYPTAEHLRILRERGPCEIHRLTFRGVRSD
jgi:ribonuclease HII